MKYVKNPIVLEAFKWTGDEDQIEDPEWIVEAIKKGTVIITRIRENSPTVMMMNTKDKEHVAQLGDYIIQGLDGEIYPRTAEVFEKIYSPCNAAKPATKDLDWKLKFIKDRIEEEMLNDCPAQKPLKRNLGRVKDLGIIADAIITASSAKAPQVHADDFHHYEMPYIKIDFQERPVKEVGDNGCQNEDVIESVLLHRMRKLQEAFPCVENEQAIGCLEGALEALKSRTQKRTEQGVEGRNKPHVS